MQPRKYCKYCSNSLRNHLLPNVNSPNSNYFYIEKEVPTKEVSKASNAVIAPIKPTVSKQMSSHDSCTCTPLRGSILKKNSSDSKLKSSSCKISKKPSTSYNQQLEKCQAEAKQLKELEKELENIKTQVTTLTKNKALVMTYTCELQQRHNMLLRKSEEQGKEIQNLKNENRKICQQLYSNPKTNISNSRMNTITEVQKNLEICEERLTKLYNQFKDSSNMSSCRCGAQKAVSKQCCDKSAHAALPSQSHEDMQSRIEELVCNYEMAKENQARCQAENEQLTRNIIELKEQLQSAIADSHYHRKSLEERDNLYGEMDGQCRALKEELGSNCEEIKKLRAMNEQLQMRAEEKAREAEEMEGRYQQLLEQYQTLEEKYKQAEENSKENFRQLELMKESETKLKSELKKMYDELQQITKGKAGASSTLDLKNKGTCTCVSEMAQICKCTPASKDQSPFGAAPCAETCALKAKLAPPPRPMLPQPPPMRPPQPQYPRRLSQQTYIQPPIVPQQFPRGPPPLSQSPPRQYFPPPPLSQSPPRQYSPPPPQYARPQFPQHPKPPPPQMRPPLQMTTFQIPCVDSCGLKNQGPRTSFQGQESPSPLPQYVLAAQVKCGGSCSQQQHHQQQQPPPPPHADVHHCKRLESHQVHPVVVEERVPDRLSGDMRYMSPSATHQEHVTANTSVYNRIDSPSNQEASDVTHHSNIEKAIVTSAHSNVDPSRSASSAVRSTEASHHSNLEASRTSSSIAKSAGEPSKTSHVSAKSGSRVSGFEESVSSNRSGSVQREMQEASINKSKSGSVAFKEAPVVSHKPCKQVCAVAPCKTGCPPPKKSESREKPKKQKVPREHDKDESSSDDTSDDSSIEEFELECTCEVEEN